MRISKHDMFHRVQCRSQADKDYQTTQEVGHSQNSNGYTHPQYSLVQCINAEAHTQPGYAH